MNNRKTIVLLHRANDPALLTQNILPYIDGIEVDIRMTKDGVLVLHHDRRVRNGDGRHFWIDTLALAEAEEMGGEKIVRFEELLQKLSNEVIKKVRENAKNKPKKPITQLLNYSITSSNFILDLDLKQPGMEQKIAELLHTYNSTNVIACSPDIWILRKFEEVFPLAKIGLTYVINERWDFDSMKTARFLAILISYSLKPFLFRLIRKKTAGKDIQIASMNHRHVNQKVVQFLHEYGIAVYAWGTDRESRLLHLVELGVDGIKTKRPDLVRELI